jgi:hypothetical protein
MERVVVASAKKGITTLLIKPFRAKEPRGEELLTGTTYPKGGVPMRLEEMALFVEKGCYIPHKVMEWN